jgi:hypothetical protein
MWMDQVDLHWERMLGEFHNDTDFWNDVFHAMTADDWWDILDVAKGIAQVHSDLLGPFPKFTYNIDLLEKKLQVCKPAIKPHNRQGYNGAAVSVFMTVRDILNEMNGTPTRRWTKEQRAKELASREVTNFERLFNV